MQYLRLYIHFVKFSFSKAMHFRFDFCFRIIMDLLYYLMIYLFYQVIYSHTPLLGGYTQDQLFLFICSFFFIDALHMTVFASNAWWFPIFVNNGDLDYYLVRPVSPLFFLSLRDFAANSFFNLLITSALLIYALTTAQLIQPWWVYMLYPILLFSGTTLQFFIQMITLLPVFWTQSPRGFEELYYGFTKIVERPHSIFPSRFRFFFTFIIPLALIISLPFEFFINPRWEILATIGLLTLLCWIIFINLWKVSLRHYSSASS